MIRTAESVSPMHPDKLCDRISDAILDEFLKQDPMSRVAVETMGGHGIITVTGEVTSNAYVNIRDVVQKITGDKYGVQVNIVEQSREIAQGVDTGGAGDQGIMVGYACNETPELMPLEVMLARSLNQFIYVKYPFDGKTQVTVQNGQIKSVVASFQNAPTDDLHRLVSHWLTQQSHRDDPSMWSIDIYCNPAGDWSVGGFEADTGLTGRKLMVDNYGPRVPIGGGAFSGKDATKVDRSAAYMARKIAVDMLAACKAKEVYIYLAYAIGKAEPLQATAIVDGMEFKLEVLTQALPQYDLTPNGIIKFLDLRKPQFEKTAQWGHFGNGFTWDK
jgi:S-adenosylmethionine synthetase